jgi:hypothetical protein
MVRRDQPGPVTRAPTKTSLYYSDRLAIFPGLNDKYKTWQDNLRVIRRLEGYSLMI